MTSAARNRLKEESSDAASTTITVEDREWRKVVRAAEAYDEAVRSRPWRQQRKPKVALRRRLAVQHILDQADREAR